ncbi:FAD-binding protein [Amycolatopsis benzoatilytica]|uniref:FAD-binding protein n=1 Tax=Amycolatopsis benzoatilytica TaxID=346045 RepID=UPI0003718F2B|nr:FAD-binding protein [Amycolatopsis benzoatilytica]
MSAPCPLFVPGLDGALVTDAGVLGAAGADLGGMRTGRPSAVLRPGSAGDIQRVIARCAGQGITVAAQGAAHTVFGQRFAEGGVAVDMTRLKRVLRCDPGGQWVEVEAGILWSELVAILHAQGLRFSGGHPGYLGLTVGGTLSVGGISNAPRAGAQVDSVLALQVATGAGDLVWCSSEERAQLFESALAGLGQVGVITKARLAVEPAHPWVWRDVRRFTDLRTGLGVLRSAAASGEFDEVFAMVMPPQGWEPMTLDLYLAAYEHSGGADRSARVDRIVATVDGPAPRQTLAGRPSVPWLDHLTHFTSVIDRWIADHRWADTIKIWSDAFVRGPSAEELVADRLDEMTSDDWHPEGMSFTLVFPHDTAAFARPRLRLPHHRTPGLALPPGDQTLLVDILRAAPIGAGEDYVARTLRRNASWLDAMEAAGGTVYPIGTHGHRWESHYGDSWPEVVAAIRTFDPAGIMTPGFGIPRVACGVPSA